MTAAPGIDVAVVMEHLASAGPWQPASHRLLEVVPDPGGFGHAPRRLVDDGRASRWLHPGHRVALYADECKGYFLNLTSGQPSWFVAWRPVEGDSAHIEITAVSLSYIEADRRMTAEEQVESVPLAPELCEWLREFTNANFRPDMPRKVRAQSFLSPEERDRQARHPPGGAAPAPAPASGAQALDPQALKSLFHSDPHFRQGDGLDVAADDVHAAARHPRERQRQIERARAMGLLDDDLLEQDKPAPEG